MLAGCGLCVQAVQVLCSLRSLQPGGSHQAELAATYADGAVLVAFVRGAAEARRRCGDIIRAGPIPRERLRPVRKLYDTVVEDDGAHGRRVAEERQRLARSV